MKAINRLLWAFAAFLLLSFYSPVIMAQSATETSADRAKQNFMGVDESSMSPDEYARVKTEWIKNNQAKYDAMNAGATQRKDLSGKEPVVKSEEAKKLKLEDGTDPLENYDVVDIPDDAQGSWVLSSIKGVPLWEDFSQEQADILAEEAAEDLPIGQCKLSLTSSKFDIFIAEGNELQGECGFVEEGQQIFLVRSRLCSSCNPLLKFTVLELSDSKMSLRMEDDDGSRVYYALTFTPTK